MAAITRLEVAASVKRKLGQLAGHMEETGQGDTLTEGDFTDAVDFALRTCRFDDISEATASAEVSALLVCAEYYVLEQMLYHWAARPTVQQGAGASGLHLMVQTETTISSLRMLTKQVRGNMETALLAIGVRLSSLSPALANIVEISAEDADTSALVLGDHALPWYQESIL